MKENLKSLTINWIQLEQAASGFYFLNVEATDEETCEMFTCGINPLRFRFKTAAEVVEFLRKNDLEINEVVDIMWWNPIYLVSIFGDNEEDHGFFDSEEEAVKAARDEWNRLTKNDKKASRLELRRYANNIEVEDPESFDYDTIEWR